jgi:hypothetical protein
MQQVEIFLADSGSIENSGSYDSGIITTFFGMEFGFANSQKSHGR